MSTVPPPSDPGQDTDPSSAIVRATPELVRAADEALDQLNTFFDDEPPTSRLPEVLPREPLSQLAVRADGALLLSLEDASNVDLTGREIISCMVLTVDEVAFARKMAGDAHDDIAARIIGALPRAS